MKILTFSTRRQNSLNGVLDVTTTVNSQGRSSRAHARLCKFTSGSRRSSSRRPILRSLKSIPRREDFLHLRRCTSTSRSRHPRGQYRAGDAPGLQPVPEHSRTSNQLNEDNDKRRRIEARNTGSNGRQSGGQKPRYPVRGDVNPIASRFSSALHRCYNCCLGLPVD